MSVTRMQKIQKVLVAMKRAETARLKAKLQEAAVARATARDLRETSRAMPLVTTITEMQMQSAVQSHDEQRARDLENDAAEAEREAVPMRHALAYTLGREQAAGILTQKAVQNARVMNERRSEAVPGKPRSRSE